MKRKMTQFTIVVTTLLLGGQLSSPIQRASLQRELETLRQQGLTFKFLDNTMIEVNEESSGLKRVKTLSEPSEAEIRAWAAEQHVPILEIDPRTLDTTQWSGWFRYWTTIPLSNGFGIPLVVGDIDSNLKPEVYADYKDYISDFESAIYEIDSAGNSTRLHTFVPRLGATRQFADVDKNSLIEIVWLFGTREYLFEQPGCLGLPTIPKLQVVRDSVLGSIGTGIFIGDLDANGITDFVNTGGIPDSVSGQPLRKIFVREYDSTRISFATIWSSQFDQPLGNYGGFTADDFDGDGKEEFQCAELMGKVYVVESTGIHSYARTWSDSTPFVNLFYQTHGDIDRDGKPEFYVGATMSNGNWTTMYEADSNDHYSPRFIFHLLSGGSLDEPTYLTPDVDHDGKPEIVILSGGDLYVFKSNANDSFSLWYYKYFAAKQGIQFYDFNSDGKEDFILSRARVDTLGRGALFADIYLAKQFTGVALDQSIKPDALSVEPNYPNPFNPSTTISFKLQSSNRISLVIFDALGKEVKTLIDNEWFDFGPHKIMWDGTTDDGRAASSGVYFCRLSGNGNGITRSMILLK